MGLTNPTLKSCPADLNISKHIVRQSSSTTAANAMLYLRSFLFRSPLFKDLYFRFGVVLVFIMYFKLFFAALGEFFLLSVVSLTTRIPINRIHTPRHTRLTAAASTIRALLRNEINIVSIPSNLYNLFTWFNFDFCFMTHGNNFITLNLKTIFRDKTALKGF